MKTSFMEKKKVCFICSQGGHFEQIKQLRKVREHYECFYVLTKTKATSALKDKVYLTTNLERKNNFIFLLNVFFWMIEEFSIFMKERPDVVITTGAANVIPMCLIAKIFGKKVIFIETFARINSPSKTGKLMYKYADLFIVQWESLLQFYPNAVYGGWIY